MRLLGWLATVVIVPAIVGAWVEPWLQSLTVDGAKTGLSSLIDTAIRWLTYPVELSVITILAAVGVLAWFLVITIRKLSTEIPLQAVSKSNITAEDVTKLAELADQDDYRELVNKEGKVVTVRSVPLDNYTHEERRLLRVLSLADLAPVPAEAVSTIFESNVAMIATLNSLQAKHMIEVDHGQVMLTASGVAWAQHQLSNGLGKRFPPVRPEPPTPDLSDEQVFILRLLSKDQTEQGIEALQLATGLNEVRFGHALDILKGRGLVKSTGYLRRHTHKVSLTSEGRAYVVQHDLDSQEGPENV